MRTPRIPILALVYGKNRKELVEGYRRTTNNRMELMAVIRGLESLNQQCSVQIFTDSRYVRDAFEKNWIKKWRSNGWKTISRQDVANRDLWMRLSELCEKHHCSFHWVKGHGRNRENNRCDELAVAAGKRAPFSVDRGYEQCERTISACGLAAIAGADEQRPSGLARSSS